MHRDFCQKCRIWFSILHFLLKSKIFFINLADPYHIEYQRHQKQSHHHHEESICSSYMYVVEIHRSIDNGDTAQD